MGLSSPERPAGLLSYFTRHRTLANLLFVSLMLVGLFAASNMRTQNLPDIVRDNVDVIVDWQGASAVDMDQSVAQVLEAALIPVDGVTNIWSRSSEGRTVFRLSFKSNWDLKRAVDDVDAAVEGLTGLPDEIDEIQVKNSVRSDLLTDIVISGPVSARQISQFGDELVLELFSQGVTQVEISGRVPLHMRVVVPSASLVAHNITLAEIAARIEAEVDTDPAGEISGANLRVRTGAAARTPEDIAALVI
ncbi:MAG: efflux RND transporter permease subunit, partial [Pseudomonadota bacterium]